jgi:hypothetical protein
MAKVKESIRTHRHARTRKLSKGQQVGYLRVSSLDKNEVRQLEGLALDKTFDDKASGEDVSGPNWRQWRASSAKAIQWFVTRWTGWPATSMTCGESCLEVPPKQSTDSDYIMTGTKNSPGLHCAYVRFVTMAT